MSDTKQEQTVSLDELRLGAAIEQHRQAARDAIGLHECTGYCAADITARAALAQRDREETRNGR